MLLVLIDEQLDRSNGSATGCEWPNANVVAELKYIAKKVCADVGTWVPYSSLG
jgi:hypothetical protein